MELKLLEETDNTIEIEIQGEGYTILQLLQSRLLEKSEVEYATYFVGHEELDIPRIFVRVNKGNPRKLLIRTANEISKEIASFKKRVQ